MNDTEIVTETPIARRQLWLTIALAVTQHRLPEPEISMSDHDYDCTPYIYLRFDRHESGRRWAEHFGAVTKSYDRPNLRLTYVDAEATLAGWRVHVTSNEPLPTETEAALAAEVAAAILTPDAEVAA